jgi:hypothetical protein
MKRRRRLLILALTGLLLLGADPQGCEQAVLDFEPGQITVVRDAPVTVTDQVQVALIRRDGTSVIVLDPEHKKTVKTSLVGGDYTVVMMLEGKSLDDWKLDLERVREQIHTMLNGPIDPVQQALLSGEIVRIDTLLSGLKGETDKPKCDGSVRAGKQVTVTIRWNSPTGEAGFFAPECESSTGP